MTGHAVRLDPVASAVFDVLAGSDDPIYRDHLIEIVDHPRTKVCKALNLLRDLDLVERVGPGPAMGEPDIWTTSIVGRVAVVIRDRQTAINDPAPDVVPVRTGDLRLLLEAADVELGRSPQGDDDREQQADLEGAASRAFEALQHAVHRNGEEVPDAG